MYMEERKWETLEKDCLVQIMSRVGMETLVFSIPKVCKSWHGASLDPLCWRNLIFPELYVVRPEPNPLMFRLLYEHGHSGLTAFIKFVVDRSQRSAVSLQLPSYCNEHAFEYVSSRCPALKSLNLPYALIHNHGVLVSKAIGNWKKLEVLTVRDGHMLSEILTEIKIHCEKFAALNCSSFKFGDKEASAIVKVMPEIKKLSIENCWLPRENVVMILKGCNGLEALDVSKCFLVWK